MKEIEEQDFDLISLIGQAILDKKGENPIAFDVREIASFTDYFIFAQGNVSRHLKAIINEIEEVLKKEGISPLSIEGSESCDWVVIDYGFIVVHLFTPDTREHFSLERLWSAGSIINMKLNVPS